MVWYYKDGDQELGPVSKTELQMLIKTQKVTAQTLVRSVEMTEWRPLAEVVNRQAHSASPPAQQATAESIASDHPMPAASQAPSTAVCSQCGRSFPYDQVVKYDNQVICAACKPMFVQKLKEGADLPRAFRYAGFWIRFVAKFIDGIILAIAQWALILPMSMMLFPTMTQPNEMPSAGFFMVVGFQQLIGILIPAAYNTFFVGRFGATPGKMACRLKVVDPAGEKVSYMRALGRNFAEWISALILLIGYIMAGFDAEKRALHDRVCSTRVVYK